MFRLEYWFMMRHELQLQNDISGNLFYTISITQHPPLFGVILRSHQNLMFFEPSSSDDPRFYDLIVV